jgi:hypothetical protein
MSRRPKPEVAAMWINPHSTLSRGHITWDRRQIDSMNARYLDLAEISLRAEMVKPQAPLIKAKSKKATACRDIVSITSQTKF